MQRDGEPGEALLELVDDLGVAVAARSRSSAASSGRAARIVLAVCATKRSPATARRRASGSSAASRSRTKPEAGSSSVRPSHEPTPTIRGPSASATTRAPAGPSGTASITVSPSCRGERLEHRAGRARGSGAARELRDPRPEPPRAVLAPRGALVGERAEQPRHRRARQPGRARHVRDRDAARMRGEAVEHLERARERLVAPGAGKQWARRSGRAHDRGRFFSGS